MWLVFKTRDVWIFTVVQENGRSVSRDGFVGDNGRFREGFEYRAAQLFPFQANFLVLGAGLVIKGHFERRHIAHPEFPVEGLVDILLIAPVGRMPKPFADTEATGASIL